MSALFPPTDVFPPTPEAAQARLDAVDPKAYARSRNSINGAVTRLSPYLTHGIITLPEAYQRINARTPLEPQGKLVFEFGWREYHHHVWAHLGERIHRDLHPGLLDASAHAAELPEDVRQAATGIPAIDEAVLAANPRMGMQLKNLARLSGDQRSAIVEKAAHHRATTVLMTPAAAGEPG